MRYFLLLLSFLFFAEITHAQSRENDTPFGRRKKEKTNQRRQKKGFFAWFKKKQVSAGNADGFASNSIRKRGFLSKMFSKKSGYTYKRTKPGKVQNREQKYLFRKHTNPSKRARDKAQKRHNGNRRSGNIRVRKTGFGR